MFKSSPITEKELTPLINRALEEDIHNGDVTTDAVVDNNQRATAIWKVREKGVIAGLEVARLVFQKLDSELSWIPAVEDGDKVDSGTEIVEIKGQCRAILTAERIALNFAQRMSGIATTTRTFTEKIEDLDTRILDTRKTTPGLRRLDKYAVAAGGGANHRMALSDLAMIKDNHIVAAGGIKNAVDRIREYSPEIQIEVETATLKQVKEAILAGADIIMLDNMNTELMKEAVALIDGRATSEASGNITLERVREVAATGVDYVSVGALTHSVKALDISQQLQNIV